MLFIGHHSICHLQKLKNYSNDKIHNSKVSIIIAVRDGEKEIEKTIDSILNSNYSQIELIVVNDRSTDRTFEIIERKKVNYTKLNSVNIQKLPEGWLGKVHALKCGAEIATGDYLLFMDADIEINTKVINQALNLCDHFKLDHLGVIPNFIKGDFLLNLTLSNATIFFAASNRPWLTIEERRFDFARGVGAFNLVKNDFFKKTEGFSWLKMEIADDIALSILIAKNNGRSLLALASDDGPSVQFYDNFWAMVKGFEKNSYGGMANYKFSVAIIIFLLSWILLFFPIFALFSKDNPILFSLGLIYYLLNLIFSWSISKQIKSSILEVFLIPLGLFFQGMILFRAAILCHLNNGIYWRGNHYSLDTLKRECRVKIRF